jgi:hypothetical protein
MQGFHVIPPNPEKLQALRRSHEANDAAAARADELQRLRRTPRYETGNPTPLGGNPAMSIDDVRASRARKLAKRSYHPATRRLASNDLARHTDGSKLGGTVVDSSPGIAAACRAEKSCELRDAIACVSSDISRGILHKLVKNVLHAPDDKGKRRLNEDNPTLRTPIFADPASREALHFLGWRREASAVTGACTGYYLLPLLDGHAHTAQLCRLEQADECLSCPLPQCSQNSSNAASTLSLGALRPPGDVVCPITNEVMTDPVVNKAGQTYERNGIQWWFDLCNDEGRPLTDPMTKEPLADGLLIPNRAVQRRAVAFKHLAPCNHPLAAQPLPPRASGLRTPPFPHSTPYVPPPNSSPHSELNGHEEDSETALLAAAIAASLQFK